MPGDITVVVQAEGWPPASALAPALARGETREVTVSLTRGVPLRGRVVDSEGKALAETDVAYWTDSEQRAFGRTDAGGALVVVLLEGTLSLAPLPPTSPDTEAEQGGQSRRFRGPTQVVSAVLAGLTARATAALGPGEGPIELQLRPE